MGRQVLDSGISFFIDLLAVFLQGSGLRPQHLNEVPAFPIRSPKLKRLCREEIVRRNAAFILEVDDLSHGKCLKGAEVPKMPKVEKPKPHHENTKERKHEKRGSV
jgi:hypothetical protein